MWNVVEHPFPICKSLWTCPQRNRFNSNNNCNNLRMRLSVPLMKHSWTCPQADSTFRIDFSAWLQSQTEVMIFPLVLSLAFCSLIISFLHLIKISQSHWFKTNRKDAVEDVCSEKEEKAEKVMTWGRQAEKMIHNWIFSSARGGKCEFFKQTNGPPLNPV